MHASLVVLMTGCLLMPSCTDALDNSRQSNYIRFMPEVQSSWFQLSRANSESSTRYAVLPVKADGTVPIYLHTLYTDSIQSQPDDEAETRAAPVSAANIYTSFGVLAYTYTGAWDGTQSPNYMYDVPVSKSGDTWTPPSTYYWPGEAYKVRFFAYAPKGNNAYRLSGQTAGHPTLTCTVPDAVAAQADLLVAASGEINGNSNIPVNLTFHHALTAVKFVCGNEMNPGVVKRVTLKNVYSQGTYDLDDQTWKDHGRTTSFTQELNKTAQGTEGEAITSEAQTFMMIPQTLPEAAKIEVIFADAKGEHTLSATLAKSVWPMGKTVTYKISTSSINWEYTLSVTGTEHFTHNGGTNSYQITSYRTNSTTGTKEPAPWTAEFSTDGQNWTTRNPDWVTAFTANGNGSLEASSYDATLSSTEGITSNEHTDILRKAQPRGSASAPYDLSTGGSSNLSARNTANCYVVNAPGWYCFPLVYGNAVKAGEPNKAAYISPLKGNSLLTNFINHLGKDITDPYINNNADCTVSQTELAWQDAKDLVGNISYEGSGQQAYIKFYVDPSSICQGNALITAKNAEGTIVWSWHIWVTDEDLTKTLAITNHTPKTYQLMPVYVGFCEGDRTTYPERSCFVRIKTKGGDQTFELIQDMDTFVPSNAPYYQGGRKDPFTPSNGYVKEYKTLYDASGKAYTSAPEMDDFSGNKVSGTPITAKKDIAISIQRPTTMQKITNKRYSSYMNLWNAIQNIAYKSKTPIEDQTVVKTIYDPCPPGFCLPPAILFSGMSISNNFTEVSTKVSDVADLNALYPSAHGVTIYGGLNKTGDKIFNPALGAIENTDNYQLRYLDEEANLWTASGKGTSYVFWSFMLKQAIHVGSSSKDSGLPVRGIKEQ
mgnify:FL=1